MDCRTARTLINPEDTLTPDEQRRLTAHLAQCPACRDDLADPMGRALAQTTIELALPPPDFTAKLLQRLPQAAPLDLARQANRQQQQRRQALIAGAAGILGIGVVIGLSLQSLWTGTALSLAAHSILDIVAAFSLSFFGILLGAVVVALLLRRAILRPTLKFTLGAAAVACGMLLVSGGTILSLDRMMVDPINQRAVVATLAQPIRVADTVQGDVVSLWGDIVVDGRVGGNVVSILGDVTLGRGAQVGGDVLAGSGQITSQTGQIAGVERRGVFGTPIQLRAVGASGEQLSPSLIRGLTGLLAALITLALAGMLVLLWPQRTLRTSRVLPTQPWLALGIGVLITALLALLTLPLLALLALTVVGLLLVPLLLLLLHLPYVQGLAAVGQALGQRLTGNATVGSALWGVAAQLLVVIGVGLIAPPIGLIIFYLLASLGLGAQLLERRTSWSV